MRVFHSVWNVDRPLALLGKGLVDEKDGGRVSTSHVEP